MSAVETRSRPCRRRGARADADARARVRHAARGAAELRARVGSALLGRGRAGRGRDREARAPSVPPASRRSSTHGVRPRPNVPRLQRINAEVDLNMSSRRASTHSSSCRTSSATARVDAIAELFVREIREGIDDTGVKAAFLKCAVEQHGIVGDIPRILAAVSAAAVETGAPVMVHTNARRRPASPALEALTSAGVEPARIVIAHAGDSNDLAYLRAIADTGAWLGCDRFSIEHFNPRREADRDARSPCSRRATATASTSRTTPRASSTS